MPVNEKRQYILPFPNNVKGSLHNDNIELAWYVSTWLILNYVHK